MFFIFSFIKYDYSTLTASSISTEDFHGRTNMPTADLACLPPCPISKND